MDEIKTKEFEIARAILRAGILIGFGYSDAYYEEKKEGIGKPNANEKADKLLKEPAIESVIEDIAQKLL